MCLMQNNLLARLSLGVALAALAIAQPNRTAVQLNSSSGAAPLIKADAAAKSAAKNRVSQAYGKLPLSFQANRGQTDPRVDFIARGSGYSLFLSASEAVLSLSPAATKNPPALVKHAARLAAAVHAQERSSTDSTRKPAVVRMTLVDANPNAKVAATEALPGRVNYLLGNDPARWRTGIPTYAKAAYEDVYRGIDVVYYGNQGQLEYDFIIRPGSSPDAISQRFDGADRMELDDQGDLLLHTAGGTLRQGRPHVYQLVDGRRQDIAGSYVLHQPSHVSFAIGAYDASQPLVIDPVLAYSTYLGGTNSELSQLRSIAVDFSGQAFVTGYSLSIDFPTTVGAFDTTHNGSYDAFVARLSADGSALEYSTYLGGTDADYANGIAIDELGNVYVAGSTTSTNFPTTAGAFQSTNRGGQDVFVTKLAARGSALLYSTYLGGINSEYGHGIALDGVGSAFVTGYTTSGNFPTTPGAFDAVLGGAEDVFVAKLNPSGSALDYSTYIGGSNLDEAYGIALDTAGNAHVTGATNSADFPTTPGAFDGIWDGTDAFVTKLNASGSALDYSTFLGGSSYELGYSIAVDASSSTYVTGTTTSADFPTTAGAFDTTYAAAHDGFVTKIDTTGSSLIYSTFIGGSDLDYVLSGAPDASGNFHVAGTTSSPDFPTTPDAFDSTHNAPGLDAWVGRLNPSGSSLDYSTYVGGAGANDAASGVAFRAGSVYVVGYTDSADFPTTAAAFDPSFNGGFDSWVAKFAGAGPALPTSRDECKNDGWKTFGIFNNQGDCVRFVSTKGKNPPANLP
jgi:hypothetical protein